MPHQAFQFKQFSVKQDKSAMKIGTDSILLGSWTNINHKPNTVLDIGAGTGILSLMMAQGSTNSNIIDAVEINENAYEQCVENFEDSQWADRLFCYHASLEEFANEINDTYDLIICNPPFYSENSKIENTERSLARFQAFMPFEVLIKSVVKLLSKKGSFNLILPQSESEKFITLAKDNYMYINKITYVKGTPNTKIKRCLMSFSFLKSPIQKNTIIIEISRHNYTEEYKKMTQDFYLNM